ncbi:hypothetical protein T4D_14546 [Trichinella pseudospiralis]|uniref:Uncharacterized protein n=1 Tax=Trichinella pseudospiralis TaxID=6337 RepID=A0A0V1FH88_TRIPS|nr:hypothetical protein T4D_14546 [Trichinella pseudospiralis]
MNMLVITVSVEWTLRDVRAGENANAQATCSSHGRQKLIAPVAANQNPLRIKEKVCEETSEDDLPVANNCLQSTTYLKIRHLPCWLDIDGYRPVDVENRHLSIDDNPLIGDTWLGDLGVDATVAPKRPGVKSPTIETLVVTSHGTLIRLDRIADAGAVCNYIIAGCQPQDEIGNRQGLMKKRDNRQVWGDDC